MMNRTKSTALLFATLAPLLFLAFITRSLAESAEQQILPGLETVDGTALTTGTINGQVDASTPEGVIEFNGLKLTDILSDTDLAITKGDSPDPVTAGKTLTYILIASNIGTAEASNVVVTDTLPGGVTLLASNTSQGSGCNEQANPVICDLGTLTAMSSATITLSVDVDSGVTGTINNQALVGSDAPDNNPANDSVSEDTTVYAAADLGITMGNNPDPVLAGQSMTYTIDVTNFGPSLTENVVVNNPLPVGVTFNSSPDCVLVGSTIICNFGDLGAGKAISTTILVDVDSATLGLIFSAVSVLSDTPDPSPANNSDVATANAIAVADLGIVKSANATEVVAGTNLTYILTINNDGPSDATVVEVLDTLPTGVNLISTSTSQGSGCNEATNPVTCNLGTLKVSSSATITMVVSVNSGTLGMIQNQAEVDSNTPDNNQTNDNATEDTTIIAEADLAISKTDQPDPVTAGENLIFTLAITNIGPSAATGVVVTDNLPPGVQLVSAIPSQGGPCSGSQTITCTLGTLGVNANAWVEVVVKVNSAQIAALLNIASVDSNAADLNVSNNDDNTSTSVVRSADLSISKNDQPDPVIAGELLTYTLTINNAGPSDATSIVVTDMLPPEVTLTDATTSTGGGCTGSSTVVCSFGDLSVDSIATVTLLVTVDPGIETTIYNTATVTSEVEDLLPSNNSKTESTTVVEQIFRFYMPILTKGSAKDEPNNTCEQAFRILSNVNYAFFPDDKFDWYHFDTSINGSMTAILSNFKPRFGQIALYKGSSCDSRVFLGNNGSPSQTKTVNANFQTAGHFYVFVSNDGVLTDKDPYNLIVTVTK